MNEIIELKFEKEDIERIKKLAEIFFSYYELETWSFQDVEDMRMMGHECFDIMLFYINQIDNA